MNEVFNKFTKRARTQGIISSCISSAIISFIALFLFELFAFIFDITGLYWVGIIVFAILFIVLVPVLYFARYKPTERTMALTLDGLGADERFITTLECKDADTTIIRKQRESTIEYAKSVPVSAIKIIIPVFLAVMLAIGVVLGIGSTTYVALADKGIAPNINDVVAGVDDLIHEDIYYTVTYDEYDLEDTYDGYTIGDGYIVGDMVQIVKEGEGCLTVYAEAIEGSAFYMWSDGLQEISRTDTNITGDLDIYAIFIEVEEQDGDEGDGDGEAGEGDEGDGDSSAMGEETASGDSGEGEGSEGDGQSSEGTSDEDQGQGTGGGAGSGSHGNTNVKDNNTDYKDEIDGAVEDAGDKVNGNGNYSDEEKSIVDDYFDGLH